MPNCIEALFIDGPLANRTKLVAYPPPATLDGEAVGYMHDGGFGRDSRWEPVALYRVANS
jgi:hypothetical protein